MRKYVFILYTIFFMGLYLSFSCLGTDLEDTLKDDRTLTLNPVADAYINENRGSTNFGGDDVLLVDQSPANMQSLLRFSIPSGVGNVISATLRLYNGDGGHGPDLYATSNDWSENGVTWNNRPSRSGSRIARLSGTTGWKEVDVTTAIRGSGDYSFLLIPSGSNGVDFHSREGSNRPQLIVVIEGGDNTLNPVADSYVNASARSNNFGRDSLLLVDESPENMRTLLRFSVPPLGASVESATLRLFVTNAGNGPDVYLTSNDWSETSVNWNNKPSPIGSRIADLSELSTGWLEIDVTSAIGSSGDYSFLLIPTGDNGVDFHSREGSNKPELIVTTGEGVDGDGDADGDGDPDVDATTLDGHLMFGYQGWFACDGDGSPTDRWVHWFHDNTPDAENATFDLWPDMSQLGPDERCDTDMTLRSGRPAQVYSAWNKATVVRHFAWMEEHGLDGVFLQRFTSELRDSRFREFRDQVTRNVKAGAEEHGRVFVIMYDISGTREDSLFRTITEDWTHLVDDLGVTDSDRYLNHRGRPLVAIWGFGFTDRPGTADQAMDVIDWFHSDAPRRLRATVMGGVPTRWRTLGSGSRSDPAWATVYRSFDVISPWTVGRYANDSGADDFRRRYIEPDLAAATDAGADYLPVVFPGFSWHNLRNDELNEIPRRGGRFYWRQIYNAIDAGVGMIYTAMYDEVDEGTAMFRLAPTSAELPREGTFLSLDADGESLPSDWYLRLAGEATKALRGEMPLSVERPINP